MGPRGCSCDVTRQVQFKVNSAELTDADKRAHAVGQKAPNAFGLYDMLGNVWEWNADVFRSAPAEGDTAQAGPSDARSLRGGSWRNKAKQIRVSNRGRLPPDDREDDNGFRCVREATPR